MNMVGGAIHPLIQLWIGLILVVVPVHSFLASYPQRVATKNELRSLPPTLETLVTDTLEWAKIVDVAIMF